MATNICMFTHTSKHIYTSHIHAHSTNMKVHPILNYIYFEITNAQSSNIFFLVLSLQEYQELLFINSGNYHLILNNQAEK